MTIRQIINIEITTHCNFDCDYCYTKKYDSRMMSFDTFKQIVDTWRDHPDVIDFSLSGEGESLLHPQFWNFVDYIRQTTKHLVSTISNGSTLTDTNIRLVAQKLHLIRVSLDTMDPELAESVGRHFHDRVVANIRRLVQEGVRVLIMTTDFGQDIAPVREFIRSLRSDNISQATQSLQSKTDYASVYTMFAQPMQFIPRCTSTVMCGNILSDSIMMYTVDGVKMPCCFIKDQSVYPGYDVIVEQMTNPTNTNVPECCTGCVRLVYKRVPSSK